jgi:putative addiction module component (TIGR02574 family)
MAIASQILDIALRLNPDERAELAHTLLLSLEPADVDENADQEWAAEIRGRLQAIRDGRVELRDWDEALLRVRQAMMTRGKG